MSPREFYYAYYDRRPKNRTFQQDTITPRTSDWLSPAFAQNQEKYSLGIKKALSFRPLYSNDYRIERIFLDLLKNLAPCLHQKLLRMFVAHVLDPAFESYVLDHKDEIDGEIVFIKMGLSSLVINYAEVMASFMMTLTGFQEAPWLIKQLYRDLDILKELQNALKGKGTAITSRDYEENYLSMSTGVRELSTYFSQAALAFLVAHEIAHYVLGHLNKTDDYYKYIRFTFEDVIHSTGQHQMEFHADLLGMFLVSENLKNVPISNAQNLKVSTFAAVGAQLLFTVLGQQSDPFGDSQSHPRILHRYNINANLLKLIMNKEEYEWVISLNRGFQRILLETQGHGLGTTIDPGCYVMPWADEK